MDPVTGIVRCNFGAIQLTNGLDFIPIAMGLFGISEIIISIESDIKSEGLPIITSLFPKKEEWKPVLGSIFRGTGIGFILGLIPGTNAVIPTLISYGLEKKIAKDPSRFGKGALEGVAGPETANNAFAGAALIPLFTLGIPSSPTIAVLMGAFLMHGLMPGPQLFQKNPDFVWAVIASMFIGNFILLIMNLPLAGFWAKILKIPYKILFPIILAVTIAGAYGVNNSMFDVGVMFVFGIAGYFFKKVDIPLAPILLTFVLGRLMEDALLQSMTIFRGSFLAFFSRPISGTMLVFAIIILVVSIIAGFRNKKGALASDVDM
jgi:putative tricarboxylic transport membrane protein